MKKFFSLFISMAVLVFAVSPVMAATSLEVYDALPSVVPDTSYPSQPFQAQQVYEFGDLIHLDGTNRILDTITVTMSDYALYSNYSSDSRYSDNSTNWTHPITLNIYSSHLGANGAPDTKLGSVTQTINIPWRPEGDETCPMAYGTDHQWRDTTGRCNYGYAFNAVFDLSSLNLIVPDDIIVSVAFNTQSYGVTPIGTNGPYNSLNVAVPNNQIVSVGSDNTDSVFLNSTWSGAYATPGTLGILREDTGWTPNGTMGLQVKAIAPVIRSATITSPTTGQSLSGNVTFKAYLVDDDVDNIQWAVRKGTCAAATNTVFGNVDEHSDVATLNQSNPENQTFSFVGNMSTMDSGMYCFIYNPVEDAGESNIRETVQFNLIKATPTNKDECKKDGWMNFSIPTFKNQGDCISYVQSNEHAVANKEK